MLGKLIKHEFKAIGRIFLGMYAFMIILTPIFSLLMRIGERTGNAPGLSLLSFMKPMSIAGYIILMIASFIASYVLIVMRFYRTVSTSEAYLTFTLPVPTWQIIFSKWLTSLILEIITAILAVLSIVTTLLISNTLTWSELINGLRNYITFTTLRETGAFGFLILFAISLLVSTAAGIAQFYCAISLGQLMHDHRVIASIAFYMALYMGTQIVSLAVIVPLTSITGEIRATDKMYSFVNATFGISITLNLIFGAVFFFVTYIVLKKKLNVH